jgi:hypothetical protein
MLAAMNAAKNRQAREPLWMATKIQKTKPAAPMTFTAAPASGQWAKNESTGARARLR